MCSTKHKLLFVALLTIASVLLAPLASGNSYAVRIEDSGGTAQPIPAGCPGSQISGPGTVDCSKIPLGCPGSTQQGPVASAPRNCPYYASTSSGASSGPQSNTSSGTFKTGDAQGKYVCGGPKHAVPTGFNIGCKGVGNPITDAAFAIIRFLSLGVGLIIVGSLTYAGIQYTMSRGDPKATAEAIGRIRSNIIAFLIFLFAFAILNYLIPKGFIGL